MERLEIAYFDEVIQIVYKCDACGWRRADLHITKQEAPMRYELAVQDEDDLSIRVVRSASGHFEIPELGVRATPAEASDAFISNTEGVLDRCIGAIETALHGSHGEQKAKAQALLERAEGLRSLEQPWTLILEDPLGNSAILSDAAARRELTEEEAEALGLPYPIYEMSELSGSGEVGDGISGGAGEDPPRS